MVRIKKASPLLLGIALMAAAWGGPAHAGSWDSKGKKQDKSWSQGEKKKKSSGGKYSPAGKERSKDGKSGNTKTKKKSSGW